MYPLTGAAAYDRAITLFSPEGKLYQVEYATKAADMGTIGLGIVYDDGVLLAADKRIASRLVVGGTEKLFKIDKHIGAVASGIVGDSRALADYARDIAERYRFLYNEDIPVHYLAREVAKLKQVYTQYGGIRPFGVVMLIGGYYKRPRLFETVPSGALTEYKAEAVGYGKKAAIELFEEKYREDMKLEDAISLAIEAIKLTIPEDEHLTPERVVMAYVDASRELKFVERSIIEKHLG